MVIAAITSCTNTSNPSVLIGAGLLARNAVAKGLKVEALGEDLAGARQRRSSRTISPKSGLQKPTSTRSASTSSASAAPPASAIPGPLPAEISKAINDNGIVAAAVLSGNRNFEGRVSPDVQANYLASPPLVVAYALAGTVTQGPRRSSRSAPARTASRSILKDIWPTTKEINAVHQEVRHRDDLQEEVRRRVQGRRQLAARSRPSTSETYRWNTSSTYVQNPPYFEGMKKEPEPVTDIIDARILGDVRRQDHHRPHLAGRLDQADLAGRQIPRRSTRCGPPTSTSTARGAATTK